MQAVAAHWSELPACEQQILIMDLQGDMTQAQLGRQLEPSQMPVSRLPPTPSAIFAPGCLAA